MLTYINPLNIYSKLSHGEPSENVSFEATKLSIHIKFYIKF